MTNEQKVNAWVDVIATHNLSGNETWIARFLIEGAWLVQCAIEDLTPLGATLSPDGPEPEYALSCPAAALREAVAVVVEQGGWLCDNQVLAVSS